MKNHGLKAVVMFAFAAVLAVSAFAQDGRMSAGSHHAKQAPGAWVYQSETLYACTHHPDVITAKGGAECAVDGCSMTVEPLSEERMAEVRAAELVACPMASCSVAATKDSGLSKCPHCGMALVEVKHDHMGEKHHKEMMKK